MGNVRNLVCEAGHDTSTLLGAQDRQRVEQGRAFASCWRACAARTSWSSAVVRGSVQNVYYRWSKESGHFYRRLNGEKQLPKVIEGVRFEGGIEIVETPSQNAA
jgi:hypothetical protein